MEDVAHLKQEKNNVKQNKLAVYHAYPLVKECDMHGDMRTETMNVCVSACEKYFNDHEGAAKKIKETLDRKFGLTWHVVVGEGFAFEITHDVKNLLYMFFTGSLAICAWRCS